MKKIVLLVTLNIAFIGYGFSQHTIIVHHKYYTLEFDTILKSPLMSWYTQTTAHSTSTLKISRKKVAAFHHDPLIPQKWQVANDDKYLNNGTYDKGHLSPYSAFYFDSIAAKESMYFTNTAPQYSFFNEHPWEELEQYILKTLSPKQDSIYVYTGCLYGSTKMKDVPVPDYYWKLIYYQGHTEAWLAPNEVTTSTDYSKYVVDLDVLKSKILTYYPLLKIPF